MVSDEGFKGVILRFECGRRIGASGLMLPSALLFDYALCYIMTVDAPLRHQLNHKESFYDQTDVPPPPPPCGNNSLTLRKHLRRLLFAAAVLFIFTACEPPGPTVTPTPTTNKPAKTKPPAGQSFTTTVSGKVTDKVGDVAAAQIAVSVPGMPKAGPAPAATGADGTFILTVKHAGNFTLKAAKAGYTPKTAEVTTKEGTRKQNFALNLIETPAFEAPIIRKSKMLVVTNGNADQRYTNRLLIKSVRDPEGAPVPQVHRVPRGQPTALPKSLPESPTRSLSIQQRAR